MIERFDNDASLVLLLGLIFAVGWVDPRLFFGYIAVAWLGNTIKEEVEKRSV